MNGHPLRELTRQERAEVRRLVTDLCANFDNQEKLCLPLDCPCYMLHGKAYLPTTSQAYCSDSCRAFARRKSERERKRRIRKN